MDTTMTPTAPEAAPETPQGGAAPANAAPGEGGAPAPTYTQADLDRAISKALETREAKLRAEMETRQLEEAGKHKQLYEALKAEQAAANLRAGTLDVLNRHGLGGLADAFNGDLSTVDGRAALAEAVKANIAPLVEAEVARRLGSTPPPAAGSVAAKQPHEMTPDEYRAFKQTHNIY